MLRRGLLATFALSLTGFSPAPVAAQDAADIRIAGLAGQSTTLRAFDALRRVREAGLEDMVVLNEIPAPPFGESERAAALASRLESTGLEVRVDAVGNVLARQRGRTGARTIAVIAHIDTVFPAETDVTVSREANVYTAPGIGDNARGLAMMLSLARAFRLSGIETNDDVLYIGSVGEEGLGDLRGVRHLFSGAADAPDIDTVVAIDGGPLERVVATAVGSNRYRVTFRGPGGHSYGDFGRANPHHALADAISRFRRAAQQVSDARGEKATFSVGRIGGGTSINSIAFESWMEVDMRSTDPERLAALDAAFRESMNLALLAENGRRREGAALELELDPVGARPAGRTPLDASLVVNAMAALRAVGVVPAITSSSTDANIPMALGIPAITISRGGVSRNAHALNETWQDDGTMRAEQAALLLLLAEAGVAPASVAAD
ncbi:MAG: M20/M25/M40 family metallo-hydrolase [Pseudomonadota bacterium]